MICCLIPSTLPTTVWTPSFLSIPTSFIKIASWSVTSFNMLINEISFYLWNSMSYKRRDTAIGLAWSINASTVTVCKMTSISPSWSQENALTLIAKTFTLAVKSWPVQCHPCLSSQPSFCFKFLPDSPHLVEYFLQFQNLTLNYHNLQFVRSLPTMALVMPATESTWFMKFIAHQHL